MIFSNLTKPVQFAHARNGEQALSCLIGLLGVGRALFFSQQSSLAAHGTNAQVNTSIEKSIAAHFFINGKYTYCLLSKIYELRNHYLNKNFIYFNRVLAQSLIDVIHNGYIFI